MDTHQHALPERLTYSLAEAAVVSGTSVSTVQRRIADGSIKSVKVGRNRLIPCGEMERFCNVSSTASAT